MLTSSEQAAALSPLLGGTHPEIYGPVIGRDLFTGQRITGSAHGLYQADVITSPNVVVMGAVGSTKSTLVKTVYVARSIAMGGRVAVFDRKEQKRDGSYGGEYVRLATDLLGAVFRFDQDPRIGTRLNVLDPAIARSSEGDATSLVGQSQLLTMLIEASLERSMTPQEAWALNRAHKRAIATAQAEGRIAVLSDVVTALYTPDSTDVPGPIEATGQPHLEAIGLVDGVEVTRWGLTIALELEKFCGDGIYAGYFDGITQAPGGKPVDLSNPMLVIDTSAIPSNSLILSVVMAITASYLAAVWARYPGEKTLIVEEAYSADKMGRVPGVFRDLAKRGRGIGLSMVSVFHHATDTPSDSPMRSLMRECEVAHIFRQDRDDDAAEVLAMFGLPEELARLVRTLPKGVHIYVRGRLSPTIVRQFRTPWEEWVTDTDEAMRHQNLPEPEEVASDDDLALGGRILAGTERPALLEGTKR